MRHIVLVVGESPKGIESIVQYLGVKVESSADHAEALQRVLKSQYALIIIGSNSVTNELLDFCAALRRVTTEATIAISCQNAEAEDRAFALNMGADDFFDPTVSLIELKARLGALVRRYRNLQAAKVTYNRLRCYTIDDLEVDVDKKEARMKGKALDLTPTEYTLLETLALCHGKTISRSQLSDRLWGYDSDAYFDNIKWHVSRLRKKLSVQEPKSDYIVTVRSKGYRLMTSEERASLS